MDVKTTLKRYEYKYLLNANQFEKVFSELNNMGKTIILITHDKNVASYAKRLITIQDGRILSDEAI